jgi:hypothetical protein
MKKNKLGIKKITLRELDPNELTLIAGGTDPSGTDNGTDPGTGTGAPGCTLGADCASTDQGIFNPTCPPCHPVPTD